jgi:hypothetical protein|tara:strand:+ start:691 stop:954 length:264 start_codon:yes stop_codon:yes gene_type:complete
MKALIFENKVVDVQENEFEVVPTMTWIDCDNTVQIGYGYDGSNFIPFEDDEQAVNEIKAKEEKALSGKQKLKDLGLDDDEINALMGV